MNSSFKHIPAYERGNNGGYLPYRPSVLRDLRCVLVDVTARFMPPFTTKSLADAVAIIVFGPPLLAYLGYVCGFHVFLEKLSWDWIHSPMVVNLRGSNTGIEHPKWHFYAAVVIGFFWGTMFFIFGLLPYLIWHLIF